jgi:hypothetical protein
MAYCSRPVTDEELRRAAVLTTIELNSWQDRIDARTQAVFDKYTKEQLDMALEIQSEMNGIKYEYRSWKAAKEKILKS